MTKKAFISAAKYYGLTVSYSGNRKIWFVKRDNTVLQLAGYVVRESKSFTEVMFNHTENIFNTYKKERAKLNGNVPAGTPKTPPNGSNGKNNVILVIIILIGIVLYSVLVDSLLKLICK